MTDTLTTGQRQRALKLLGYYVTSAVRCAARYAALVDCSITEAAREFGVTPGGVWLAWARIFPRLPQPIRPYGCAVCGHGNHESRYGKCSRTGQALLLVESGHSVQAAAEMAGVTVNAVYVRRYQIQESGR